MLMCSGFEMNQAESAYDYRLETLGHYLFFEKKLSLSAEKSCASCHDPNFAFADGYNRSLGLYGDPVLRNAPSLLNVRDRFALGWADDGLKSLEKQMERPLFGMHPPEMGAFGQEDLILSRLKQSKFYRKYFRKLFPHEAEPIRFPNIIIAIAAYEKGLNSMNSPYDRYLETKDTTQFGFREIRGMHLFFSDRLSCINCHHGRHLDEPDRGFEYANVGLYFCENLYPDRDRGLFDVTGDSLDIGRFRIPSLRNVAITAPYFHDGSVQNLNELIEIYSRGGRYNKSGDCPGDGKDHPNRDPRMSEFQLSEEEKKDLLHFLYALTDTSYLRNPYFLNPHRD